MLQALLAGKLSRPEEELEDLLTSNVFGSLSYVADSSLLFAFLGSSSTVDGTFPLRALVQPSHVSLQFWPTLARGAIVCEPDVLVTYQHPDGTKTLVLIEAKFRSGKGRAPDWAPMPRDQLAREAWCLGGMQADRRHVVYITADFTLPESILRESILELSQVDAAAKVSFTWTTWRVLAAALRQESTNPFLSDLRRVLVRLHLTFFEGVDAAPAEPGAYRFTSDPASGVEPGTWRFVPPPPQPPAIVFGKSRHWWRIVPHEVYLERPWRFQE